MFINEFYSESKLAQEAMLQTYNVLQSKLFLWTIMDTATALCWPVVKGMVFAGCGHSALVEVAAPTLTSSTQNCAFGYVRILRQQILWTAGIFYIYASSYYSP